MERGKAPEGERNGIVLRINDATFPVIRTCQSIPTVILPRRPISDCTRHF